MNKGGFKYEILMMKAATLQEVVIQEFKVTK